MNDVVHWFSFCGCKYHEIHENVNGFARDHEMEPDNGECVITNIDFN